jgi:hypothetical protein
MPTKTTRKRAAAKRTASSTKATATRRAASRSTARVTGRQAIAKVLADGQPRPAKEITAAAVKLIRPVSKGKTPEATLGAFLYTQAKKPDGLVEQTGRGEFRLRPEVQA